MHASLPLSAAAASGMIVAAASAHTVSLPITIRDFTPTTHPDFERYNGDDRGMVQGTLDAARLPIFDTTISHPSVTSQARFDQFYRDTPDVNLSTTQNLVLDNAQPAQGGVYSYTNNEFFPIDGQLFGNYESFGHNYHFTVQLSTDFTYQPGMSFSFTGDDDLWVFINHQLVIDLGGVHGAETASVNLDTLGLTPGSLYDFDLFFAERHTTASTFAIQTSIVLPAPGAGLALSAAAILAQRRRRR